MLSLIEGAQVWIKNLATRPEEGKYMRVTRLFQDARAHLEHRLHHHSVR
jgi:hypothetical protein